MFFQDPALKKIGRSLVSFVRTFEFFIERKSNTTLCLFQHVLSEVYKHDITEGRPNIAAWIEAMNKIDAYSQTRPDPEDIVVIFQKRFVVLTSQG
ncbi:hypothetical protein RJT34_19879 [Clitoria ternatea]|uniref:Uncharacterized protein n=1 Tax=Clitoria ternatea TaxID=43366 RepID=A0AAN9IS02_CLITE